MDWTVERIELLRKLWSEGLSASQIAGQLGGVTRNAVIGKVHRLKLSSRGRTTAAPARQKKPTARAATVNKQTVKKTVAPSAAKVNTPKVTKVSEAVPAAEPKVKAVPTYQCLESNVIPMSSRLQLVQLSEKTCKWPNGDPLSEDFSFCGNDADGPYCSYHSKIAFQPASERRRSR